MPTHTPSERRKNANRNANRLGSSFGGLLGGAVTALRGQTKVGGKTKGKKRKTRKQMLDEI